MCITAVLHICFELLFTLKLHESQRSCYSEKVQYLKFKWLPSYSNPQLVRLGGCYEIL